MSKALNYLRLRGIFEEGNQFMDCECTWDSVGDFMEGYSQHELASLRQENERLKDELSEFEENNLHLGNEVKLLNKKYGEEEERSHDYSERLDKRYRELCALADQYQILVASHRELVGLCKRTTSLTSIEERAKYPVIMELIEALSRAEALLKEKDPLQQPGQGEKDQKNQ